MESRLSEEVSRTSFGNKITVTKADPHNIYGENFNSVGSMGS